MGRPRKETMRTWLGILTGMVIGTMFYSMIIIPAAFNSRLKKLEAATYSAQQPLERNCFAGSSCDTVYIDHGTSIVYKGACFVAK